MKRAAVKNLAECRMLWVFPVNVMGLMAGNTTGVIKIFPER